MCLGENELTLVPSITCGKCFHLEQKTDNLQVHETAGQSKGSVTLPPCLTEPQGDNQVCSLPDEAALWPATASHQPPSLAQEAGQGGSHLTCHGKVARFGVPDKARIHG